MFHEKIKSLFSSAVHSVSSIISEFTANPGSDLTRHRKLPAEKLITFLVSQGASGTKNELLDFLIWIHRLRLLPPSTSSGQNSGLMPLSWCSGISILQLPHQTGLPLIIVLLLLTVPALPSPADLPLLPPNILCLRDILPGAFTLIRQSKRSSLKTTHNIPSNLNQFLLRYYCIIEKWKKKSIWLSKKHCTRLNCTPPFQYMRTFYTQPY